MGLSVYSQIHSLLIFRNKIRKKINVRWNARNCILSYYFRNFTQQIKDDVLSRARIFFSFFLLARIALNFTKEKKQVLRDQQKHWRELKEGKERNLNWEVLMVEYRGSPRLIISKEAFLLAHCYKSRQVH